MRSKSLLMTISILIIAMNTGAQVKGTFRDARDGKIYKTVKIGTQTWMAENLAYGSPSTMANGSQPANCNYRAIFSRERINRSETTWEYMIFCGKELEQTMDVDYHANAFLGPRFSFSNTMKGGTDNIFCGLIGNSIRYGIRYDINKNGIEIGRTEDSKDAVEFCIEYYFNSLPKAAPRGSAICSYGNDNLKTKTYGNLYIWDAAMTACPRGWHLPSDAEWTTLTTNLGGENVASGKMKEKGLVHWTSPNQEATNSSGFTALPGGNRYADGTFGNLGDNGNWWCSSDDNEEYAWGRGMYYKDGSMFRSTSNKSGCFSVRCIKD